MDKLTNNSYTLIHPVFRLEYKNFSIDVKKIIVSWLNELPYIGKNILGKYT